MPGAASIFSPFLYYEKPSLEVPRDGLGYRIKSARIICISPVRHENKGFKYTITIHERTRSEPVSVTVPQYKLPIRTAGIDPSFSAS